MALDMAVDPQTRFDRHWTPEPNSGCWLWFGATTNKGYGSFRIEAGKEMGAHRASWLLNRGSIADGMQILHKCDTPACVNPDHLFVGTNLDNMRDRYVKGRYDGSHAAGENNFHSKLTAADVRVIRAASGTMREIGKRFGVTGSLVTKIKRRSIWGHLI